MKTWLQSFSQRGQPAPLTRFAPSPTGHLHLGHVVHAIYVWGVTRALGGKILLRMEDHDHQRCKPAFEQSILDDLDWLGLQADMGSTQALRQGESIYRQSDREQHYRDALKILTDKGLVYGCICTRKMIAEVTAVAPGQEPRYNGHCKSLGHPMEEGCGLRLMMPNENQDFEDLASGQAQQNPTQQCGDLLIKDRRGNWTYQFCAAVDDTLQEVGLIIRGQDLQSSCGRQIALAKALGRPIPPLFLHHPLVNSEDGRKLSKRDFDSGIGLLRQQGVAASQVLGLAANLIGLTETQGSLDAKDLAELFLSDS